MIFWRLCLFPVNVNDTLIHLRYFYKNFTTNTFLGIVVIIKIEHRKIKLVKILGLQ